MVEGDVVVGPELRALLAGQTLEFADAGQCLVFALLPAQAGGDLVRAALSVDKALVTAARVFDVYEGPGVPEGSKSVAIEVTVQPRDHTLTDVEIEQLSARVVAAVEKACSAKLRT